MIRFYVYEHIDPRNQKTFYVGKGTGNRSRDRGSRSKLWHEIVYSIEADGLAYGINIIKTGMSEIDASMYEAEVIRSKIKNGSNIINKQHVNGNLVVDDIRFQYSTALGVYVRAKRKSLGMTQHCLCDRAGVGLRFIRDLESGKSTLRMDKVNQVLMMFGSTLGPVPMSV